MANITNSNTSTPSPPLLTHDGGYGGSTAMNIVLSFLALICVPFFIYAFFFCLKCPPHPSQWRRRWSLGDNPTTELPIKDVDKDLIYKICVSCNKEEAAKTEEGESCPVCLSIYVEGDEVRILNNCKHRFHVLCISKWLFTHNNCPVCRASVSVKHFNQSGSTGEYDFLQGLPDSASLV